MTPMTRNEANKALYEAILAREQEYDKAGFSQEYFRLNDEVGRARNERFLAIARED